MATNNAWVKDQLILRRLVAFSVDCLLLAGAAVALAQLATTVWYLSGAGHPMQAASEDLPVVVLAVLALAYLGVLPTYWGTTFGKYLLRLQVVGLPEKRWQRRWLRVALYPGPFCLVLAVVPWTVSRPSWEFIGAVLAVLAITLTDLAVVNFWSDGASSLHDYLGGTRVTVAGSPRGGCGTLFRRSGALAVDWWLIVVGICLAGGSSTGFPPRRLGPFFGGNGWLVSGLVVFAYLGVLSTYSGRTAGKILFRLRVVGNTGWAAWLRRLVGLLVYPAPLCGLMVVSWALARCEHGAIRVSRSGGEYVYLGQVERYFHWLPSVRVAYLAVGMVVVTDILVTLLAPLSGYSFHGFLSGTRVVVADDGFKAPAAALDG